MTLPPYPHKQPHVKLISIPLIFIVLVLMTLHFQEMPYRYDETWMLTQDSPMILPRLIQMWALVVGTTATASRWLPLLMTTLALAMIIRLARTLYKNHTFWLPLLVTGFCALNIDFIGRVTPYATAITLSASISRAFWIWQQQPKRLYALAYGIHVLVIALFFPSGLLLVGLQGIWFYMTLRPHRTKVYAIWVAIVVCGGVWIASREYDVLFAIERSIVLFNPPLHLMVGDNLQIFLLIGLAAAGLTVGWKHNPRQSAYIALLTGSGLIIGWFMGATLVAFVLPLIAIAAGQGLAILATPIRYVLIATYVLVGISLVPANRLQMPAYPNVIDQIQSDGGIIVAAPHAFQQATSLFYIRERKLTDSSFHIVVSSDAMRFLPVSPSNMVQDSDANSVQQLNQWVQSYDSLWLIDDGKMVFAESLLNKALKPFVTYTITNWEGARATEQDSQRLIRYIRIPQDLHNQFKFGDQLWLQQWILNQDVNVNACQKITVQSWWGLQQDARANYSLSLTLVNSADGQGITHIDSALGANETLLWGTGQSYFDERSFIIPCELATGDYPLLYAVYSLKDNAIQYLPVAQPDNTPLGNQLYLTTLHVQGAS